MQCMCLSCFIFTISTVGLAVMYLYNVWLKLLQQVFILLYCFFISGLMYAVTHIQYNADYVTLCCIWSCVMP